MSNKQDTGKEITEVTVIRDIFVGDGEVKRRGERFKAKPRVLERLVSVGKAAKVESPAALSAEKALKAAEPKKGSKAA